MKKEFKKYLGFYIAISPLIFLIAFVIWSLLTTEEGRETYLKSIDPFEFCATIQNKFARELTFKIKDRNCTFTATPRIVLNIKEGDSYYVKGEFSNKGCTIKKLIKSCSGKKKVPF